MRACDSMQDIAIPKHVAKCLYFIRASPDPRSRRTLKLGHPRPRTRPPPKNTHIDATEYDRRSPSIAGSPYSVRGEARIRVIPRYRGGYLGPFIARSFRPNFSLETATVVRTSSILICNANLNCLAPFKTKNNRTARVAGGLTPFQASFFVQPNTPPCAIVG